MMRFLSGFGLIAGATYPFRALGVLARSPRLWSYLAIPIAVNLVLAALLYGAALSFLRPRVAQLRAAIARGVEQAVSDLPAWLGFLADVATGFGVLLQWLVATAAFVLIGYVLVQFGNVLGSPWYGKLSEQLELKRTGSVEAIEVGIWRDIWRALLFELKKLVLAAIAGLLLLAMSFVPGVGAAVASAGGLSVTATLVCLDFFDAPLERRRLRFRQKLGIVGRSLPASASFGLACVALISVPLLNLLTIPLCVAAGTLFACDRVLPRLLPKPDEG